MKKKSKILLGVLVGVSAVAAVSFGVSLINNKGGIFNPNNNEPDVVEKLDKVSNLNYDSNNHLLSWNEVSNADNYKVDINGRIVDVSSNSYYYVPTTLQTKFKVQANDSTNKYYSSDWSDVVEYNAPTNVLSEVTINDYVSSIMPNLNLKKIVSIYAKEDIVTIKAVFDDNKIYTFNKYYDTNVTSLNQAIKDKAKASTYSMSKYEIKNYDSANYYLKSDTYKNKLETYRQEGYEFEVISSQSYEIDDATIGFDSIFKIKKDDDIKYFATNMSFYVSDSVRESERFTNSLVNIIPRYTFLDSFVELEGDFINGAKFYTASQQNDLNAVNTFGDGLSF